MSWMWLAAKNLVQVVLYSRHHILRKNWTPQDHPQSNCGRKLRHTSLLTVVGSTGNPGWKIGRDAPVSLHAQPDVVHAKTNQRESCSCTEHTMTGWLLISRCLPNNQTPSKCDVDRGRRLASGLELGRGAQKGPLKNVLAWMDQVKMILWPFLAHIQNIENMQARLCPC